MIIVTGGSGFIGQQLVRELKSSGFDVVAWDIVGTTEPRTANYVRVNVLDKREVAEAMHDAEIVYHLAGPVAESVRRQPYESCMLQLVGTLNILECCRMHRIGRIVLASSFYVYGGLDEGTIVDEDTGLSIMKMDMFGASKIMAERLVREYGSKYGLEYTIARLGSAFGPEHCTNAIKTLLESGFTNRQIEIWGAGRRRNQYTYVNDITQGLVLAANAARGVYNLVSPESTTTSELAEILCKLYGFDIKWDRAKKEAASFPKISSAKAISALGWAPTAFESALTTVAEDVRKNVSMRLASRL